MTKPSKKLEQFYELNKKRYDYVDIDSAKIATLLNLVLSKDGIAGILDEMDIKLNKLIGPNGRDYDEDEPINGQGGEPEEFYD